MAQEPKIDSDLNEVVTLKPGITSTSAENSSEDFVVAADKIEDIVETEFAPKSFKWHGVEFPAWAQGPHFVMLQDRTFALAMDPNFVTMEMKANWMAKYVPVLVQLGKQVLEKLLKEKITSL